MALMKSLKKRLDRLDDRGFPPAVLREAQGRNFATGEWPQDPRLCDLISFIRRSLIAMEIATVGFLEVDRLSFVPSPEELAEVGYDPQEVKPDGDSRDDPAGG